MTVPEDGHGPQHPGTGSPADALRDAPAPTGWPVVGAPMAHQPPLTHQPQPTPLGVSHAITLPPARRRRVGFFAGFIAMTIAVILAFTVPLPYAVLSPGPAINVLGSEEVEPGKKVPLIAIKGLDVHENTAGTLDLTTVRAKGGPSNRVTLYDLVSAWVDSSADVYSRDEIFPPNETSEQIKQENAAMMVSSQQVAAGVGLEAAGIPIPVMVTSVSPGVPAAAVLKAGDVLVQINGQQITGLKQVPSMIKPLPADTDVALVVRRDGVEQSVTARTRVAGDGSSQLGISLAPGTVDSIEYAVGEIGGPSAGLMFSLGIYDKVTPGDLTGSAKIAGTGTMSRTGQVGPIGGIKQKMVGASRVGAQYFLAPADNCPMVVGQVPSGMQVVKVATFDEALAAVKEIAAGHADALPSCG